MSINKWILSCVLFIFLFAAILIFYSSNTKKKEPQSHPLLTLPVLENTPPVQDKTVSPDLLPLSQQDFISSLTFGVGLRHDHLSSKIIPFKKGIPSVKRSKRLKIIDYHGKIEGIFRHVYFRAGGDFGWVKKGKAIQMLDDQLSDDIEAVGSTFDADVALGIEWKAKQSSLIPVIGYLYNFQKIKEKAQVSRQSPFLEETNFHWFGPFLGLNLSTHPFKRVLFNLGYSYHRVQVRQAIQEQASFPITQGYPYSYELHNEGKNGAGHRGIVGARFLFPRNWLLGFSARYQYFNSSRGNSILETKQDASTFGYYAVQWWSFQTLLELSYEF